ncbi:hypothetical protein HHK36_031906 [Tetracentron sinense]|uniref:Uncharacterized protein n=1 Tax=Tetracentron sinense TaxID=13715 RepID=A0A835D0X4_TETSI|nr:hypothetical protein HHK36_031906 [Tetracentron sinense]
MLKKPRHAQAPKCSGDGAQQSALPARISASRRSRRTSRRPLLVQLGMTSCSDVVVRGDYRNHPGFKTPRSQCRRRTIYFLPPPTEPGLWSLVIEEAILVHSEQLTSNSPQSDFTTVGLARLVA